MPKLLRIFLTLYIVVFLLEIYFQLNLHRLRQPSYYENRLLCIKPRKEAEMYTRRGYEMSPHKKIVIAGLCRNAGQYIEKNIHIANTIGSYFKDYRIVVYENDSKDMTRSILTRCAQQNQRLIVLGGDEGVDNMYNIGATKQLRFEKMAHFRNQYLAYIRKHLDDYDYMMVIDWDMNGSTDINGIMNSIGREHDWGAVGTSGKVYIHGTLGFLLINYDLLALRFHNIKYNNTNHWRSIFFNLFYQEYHRLFYSDIEPVQSTFHGIVVYKIRAIPDDAWYTTEYGCEHIGLNSKIKNIYINPHWRSYFGVQGPNWFSLIRSKSR